MGSRERYELATQEMCGSTTISTHNLTLDGEIPNSIEVKYLGMRLTNNGFMEKSADDLFKKAKDSAYWLGRQPWFTAGIEPEKVRNLFYMHIRSKLTYGLIACEDFTQAQHADERLQRVFFKLLVRGNRKTSDTDLRRLRAM